ncbi:MAG: DUF1285 domain-containing protein [Alphaproteobacteria bacterium]|nr:DUF1285 domain-containing protein [Alphaproteobacteria bacterium]
MRRLPLVKLFASVLRREADGSYWLVTPYERGRIVVDDAPFVAVEVDRIGAGEDQVLRFRTNIDEEVEAGPDRPIRVTNDPSTGAPSPYILVRPGLEARLLRPVFYHLVEFGEERKERHEGRRIDRYGVWSRSTFFPLDDLPAR